MFSQYIFLFYPFDNFQCGSTLQEKKRKCWYPRFSLVSANGNFCPFNPFPYDKFETLPILQSLQTTTLWKWQKNLETERKHCGERRNCSLRAIYPFPALFSKDLYCRHLKIRACLGKGY